jgi:Peptidase C10 family
MRIKSNSNRIRETAALRGTVALVFLLLMSVSAGFCDPVESTTARTVAENVLCQHVQIYGAWNGSPAPTITAAQAVRYQGVTVAYNFRVAPSGHVLVAVDDAFSPVLLYSTDATFDPGRVGQAGTLESLMIPALQKDVRALSGSRQKCSAVAAAARDEKARSRIRNAWTVLQSVSASTSPTAAPRSMADTAPAQARDGAATATVGPLLSTAWSQDDPYNLSAPAIGGANGCAHALTGCVATAWSQVLRYWSWPIQGQGSHSYTWAGQTLSVDFTTAYDWADMPGMLYGSSSAAEKEAVSLLMYQVGVAADMDYSCTSSGSQSWASDVLPIYFKYKTSIRLCDRANKDGTHLPYTSDEWFALLTHELDSNPPRPVIISIFSDNGSGHEAVVDGYQRTSSDLVHINFGWSGYSDGFYNITSDFRAREGETLWSADQQDAVIGIEPDNNMSNSDNSPGSPTSSGQRSSGGGGGCFIGVLSDGQLEWH